MPQKSQAARNFAKSLILRLCQKSEAAGPIIKISLIALFSMGFFATNSWAHESNWLRPNFLKHLKAQPFSEAVTPFKTDGCTFALDGFHLGKKTSWVHCCVEHDITHWAGGTWLERFQSDGRLRNCMNETSAPGWVYYKVVRRLGAPEKQPPLHPLKSQRNFPWGFGWNHFQEEDPLNENQKASVCQRLDTWMATDEFEEFQTTYQERHGRPPHIPKCE